VAANFALMFRVREENPVGLKVRWENDRATGKIRARSRSLSISTATRRGARGIVAALLDETAARTVLMDGGFDDLMVTLKLEVTYRRPTPTLTPLTVVGRLLRRAATAPQPSRR